MRDGRDNVQVERQKEKLPSQNMDKVRDIEERTFRFALNIVRLCQKIEDKVGTSRTLALQLLWSGTSVGANVEEAQLVRVGLISSISIP